jgi:hypothetical protein
MRIKLGIGAVVALTLPFVATAQMPDFKMPDMSDVHATIGVRAWQTDWSTWFFNGTSSNPTYPHAGLKVTVTPVVGIRYQDWLVSASYLVNRSFQFPGEGFKRHEYDVNVGYFIAPSLAVTAGWKGLYYKDDPGPYDWSAKGPTVGLTGSAPIAPWVSGYGNIAYGWLKVDDKNGAFNGEHGKYILTELGLAFPLGHYENMLGGAVVTAGYRYQRVSAFAGGAGAGPLRNAQLYEITQGPVAGLSWTF